MPINMQVPRSHFLVGNHILSKEYVLRYLEHLPIYTDWYYAESYRVNVLDNNLNSFVLSSNEYVELTKNGYVLRNVSEILRKKMASSVPMVPQETPSDNDVTETKDKIE